MLGLEQKLMEIWREIVEIAVDLRFTIVSNKRFM